MEIETALSDENANTNSSEVISNTVEMEPLY